MPLPQLLLFLVGLLGWAFWIIAVGDLVTRKADDFQRGSKRLWLAGLLIVPVITGLI